MENLGDYLLRMNLRIYILWVVLHFGFDHVFLDKPEKRTYLKKEHI